jgi:hypothetical protein
MMWDLNNTTFLLGVALAGSGILTGCIHYVLKKCYQPSADTVLIPIEPVPELEMGHPAQIPAMIM